MSNTKRTAAKPSIYQIVTDRIIHSLEAGVIPWEKPWKTTRFHGGPFPRNFRTGKPYRGVNVLLLWSSPHASPFWLTFKQALDLKGSVRKGEKGTPIVFYKQLQSRKEDRKATDEKKERSPFVLCYYTVFNVEQCEGITLPQVDQPETTNEIETDETCEAIVNGWADRNTAAYLQNWISQLQQDNRLILQAAANAQRAVDLILGTAFESEAEQERDEEAATNGLPDPQPQVVAV